MNMQSNDFVVINNDPDKRKKYLKTLQAKYQKQINEVVNQLNDNYFRSIKSKKQDNG